MNFNNPEINKYKKEVYDSNFDELSSQIIAEYTVDLDMVLEFELNDDNEKIYFRLTGQNIETDYGDGKNEIYDEINEMQVIHKCEKKGTHVVRIKGNLVNFSHCSYNIKKVINWNYYLENLSNAFAYCRELKEVPNYIPSNVQKMSCMFYICNNFNSDISKWNVSNIRDIYGMFYGCINFNSDISKWDVSNVQTMSYMFYGCKNFNSDISKWNVSNVRNMSGIFSHCKNFNSDISKWDISNVQNMSYMFWNCSNFNSDIRKWNVNNVCYMFSMFWFCDIPEEYKPKFKN